MNAATAGFGADGQRRRHVPAPVTYDVGPELSGFVAGDFTGDGRVDLAVTSGLGDVSVLLGNGDGTFQPPVTYSVGGTLGTIVAADLLGDGRIDLAVAIDGVDFNVPASGVSVLLGDGDGTFLPLSDQSGVRWGRSRGSIVAGDFDGTAGSTLPSPTTAATRCRCCWAMATAPSRPRSPTRSGESERTRDGRLQWRRAARSGRHQQRRQHGLGAAGQRRRHLPAPGHLCGREESGCRLVAGDFTGDGRTDLVVSDGAGIHGSCWATAMGRSSPRSPIAAGISGAIVAGDFTGDGRLDLAVADWR